MLGIIDSFPPAIYSLVEPKIDMSMVKSIATFMVILYISSALFNYVQSYSMTTVSNRFANEVLRLISYHLNILILTKQVMFYHVLQTMLIRYHTI